MTIDMSQAFIKGITDNFPDASITFDKFHVIQALNKAQDEVRRQEQKRLPFLKKTRNIWLKNPENHTKNQERRLAELSGYNLNTAKVYQMKLTFQDIYRNIANPEEAETAVKTWLEWADRSGLEPVRNFANMLKEHFKGIMQYFTTRLTTGKMESINSRIQEIKRRAKGYRNINNFIAMIYLEGADLDMGLPLF
jgi:transposase